MSSDGDMLDLVIARLWRVRERLGSSAFHAAAQAALCGIATATLKEAEWRAGVSHDRSATLVRLPVSERNRNRSGES